MASQRSNRFLVTTCAGGTLAVFSVGYPLDLVVCTALGVDMYDCVYPTRTARFGVALVSGRAPGTLRLKSNDFGADETKPLSDDCTCQACREGISRQRLQQLFKAGHAVAIELLTQHNIAYMMNLVRTMRQAILDDRFAAFASKFVREQYPGTAAGGLDVPGWVVDALAAAGISLNSGTDNVH
jgi:queuine tRNA-ribosyltransferase catalytic subunit